MVTGIPPLRFILPALVLLAASSPGCGGESGSDSNGAGGAASIDAGGTGDSAAAGAPAVLPTDGSEECSRFRSSGSFGNAPFDMVGGWRSRFLSSDVAPWRLSWSWSSHALELRGRPNWTPSESFPENAAHNAAFGYLLRATLAPWAVGCVAPSSTLRIVNDNVVVDLELGPVAACSGIPGSDALEVCLASPVSGANDPPPACAFGVTGTLDGQQAPAHGQNIGWSHTVDVDELGIKVGSYGLRIPLPDWIPDFGSAARDFSGGMVMLERDGAFDAYCVASGHAIGHTLTLSGLSRLAHCDSSTIGVEHVQICDDLTPLD